MSEGAATPAPDDGSNSADVVVVGSGAAGLTAALTAAAGGLSVIIVEKTDKLGGASAMSGAATWVPGNHHARDAGVADSPDAALEYLRATAPPGWRESEDPLWRSFARHAPDMLAFVERSTPLRFVTTTEPDVFAEAPGGRPRGRMVTPLPLRRRLAGRYAHRLRPSTMPHMFSYRETTENDVYRRPVRSILRLAPRLAWRLATGTAGKGTALVTGLLRGCLDRGCRICLETRALSLIVDDAGAVAGLTVAAPGGRRDLLARRGVVLASGGFEWDPELVETHFPGPRGLTGTPRGNEGDAIRMGRQVDAAFAHLDQALIYPCVPTRYEGAVQAMPLPFQIEPNAILVDRTGRRFTSEFAVDLGEALDRRDPDTGLPVHAPAWLIADSRLRRPVLRWYARHLRGWIKRADSIDGLAAATGLPAPALSETLERFNALCRSGRDADFGRGETAFERHKAGARGILAPIATPPYLAVPFDRCIISTKGGLRTDAEGRVVRRDGQLCPGLYCAGAAMANPIGTRAISAGTTIGPNMTWGYICGLSLASRADSERDHRPSDAGSDRAPASLLRRDPGAAQLARR